MRTTRRNYCGRNLSEASVNCIVCNGKARLNYKLKDYHLIRCKNCFHEWIMERDSVDVKNFYDSAYFKGEKACFGASFKKWKPESSLIKNRITFDISNILCGMELSRPSVLEIGPGPEQNLFRYASSFSSIESFDISPLVNTFLEDQGAKVYKAWDEIPSEKYDAVVAYEVIEHAPDSLQLCLRILSKLKKGGVFILTTGNTRSFYSRLAGRKWFYYDPPAHLNYFSDKSMRILLNSAGFSRVKVLHLGSTSKEVLSKTRLAFLLHPLLTLIASSMTVYAYK
jgi:SAM-dependent methyltransferase